jgi:hypothetical protein
MTVTIPADLEKAVAERAEHDRITVDEFVREALVGRLRLDPELLDELKAWEEISDEALRKVEGMCE